MDVENFSMNIILHAGNAKSYLYEALENARNAKFNHIEEKIQLASQELLEAHKLQTKFLQEESKNGLKSLSVLLVHAQDHLMTVMSEKNLIEEMIEMYKNQNDLYEKVNHLLELNNGEK